MTPLVTIFIPTYNQEDYILETIKSALNQSYTNLEVIVCNDASTDDTWAKICSISDPRLRKYNNESNKGRVENYRYGLYTLCKGDWFVNLDGDDYLIDPDFISRSIESISDHENIIFCQSKIRHSNMQVGTYSKDKEGAILSMSGKDYFLQYYSTTTFAHLSTLYNVKKAREANFYAGDFISADAVSTLRLASYGNVLIIYKVVGIWRAHTHNVSRISKVPHFIRNMEEILQVGVEKNSIGFINGSELRSWLRKMKAQYFIPLLLRSIKNGAVQQLKYLIRHQIKSNTPVLTKESLNYIIKKIKNRYAE